MKIYFLLKLISVELEYIYIYKRLQEVEERFLQHSECPLLSISIQVKAGIPPGETGEDERKRPKFLLRTVHLLSPRLT